jgi:hypothetical protein
VTPLLGALQLARAFCLIGRSLLSLAPDDYFITAEHGMRQCCLLNKYAR